MRQRATVKSDLPTWELVPRTMMARAWVMFLRYPHETAGPFTPLRSVEKHFHERSRNCRSLGFARDDKGKGDRSVESGCWTEAFFITLGGPKAHDSSSRDDNSFAT